MSWNVSLLPNQGWNFGLRTEVKARLDQAVTGIEWIDPDPMAPEIVRKAVENALAVAEKKSCRTPQQLERQMRMVGPVGALHELAYFVEINATQVNDRFVELRLACVGRDTVIDAVRRMAEALAAKVVESRSQRQIDFERDLADGLPLWREAMRRDHRQSSDGIEADA